MSAENKKPVFDTLGTISLISCDIDPEKCKARKLIRDKSKHICKHPKAPKTGEEFTWTEFRTCVTKK